MPARSMPALSAAIFARGSVHPAATGGLQEPRGLCGRRPLSGDMDYGLRHLCADVTQTC